METYSFIAAYDAEADSVEEAFEMFLEYLRNDAQKGDIEDFTQDI